MIEEFLARAAVQPSVQPDRPPAVEPLHLFTQESFKTDGSCEVSLVLTSDDEDPLSDERITADPGTVVDLKGWR